MDLNFIICPDCNAQIPITEALTHQITERLRKDFDLKLKEVESERLRLTEEQTRFQEAFEKEKKGFEELQKKQREEFELRLERSLAAKEVELKEASRKYLLEQKEKLKEELETEAKNKFRLELEDLKKQNIEKENKIRIAQEQELKLREEKRQLEQKEKDLEIEMVRRMDEERKKIIDDVHSKESEKFKLQQLEYEKKLKDMQEALEDARRRGEASSERFRGEVQELDLEQTLRSNFIYDIIHEVPKGVLGADVLQEVKDVWGKSCGVIVWECKRTKAFNEDWVTKLKDDVIRAKGNVAIIVSQTLPEDVQTFAYRNGIWVTSFSCYLELASVLRMNLIEIMRVEKMNEGKDQKMSQVYSYLSSDDFRYKIQSMAETFVMMKEQLDQEKKAFARQWAMREKQIERMMEGTVTIVGDLQGIMGNSLPKIEGMEMPGLGSGLEGLGF